MVTLASKSLVVNAQCSVCSYQTHVGGIQLRLLHSQHLLGSDQFSYTHLWRFLEKKHISLDSIVVVYFEQHRHEKLFCLINTNFRMYLIVYTDNSVVLSDQFRSIFLNVSREYSPAHYTIHPATCIIRHRCPDIVQIMRFLPFSSSPHFSNLTSTS